MSGPNCPSMLLSQRGTDRAIQPMSRLKHSWDLPDQTKPECRVIPAESQLLRSTPLQVMGVLILVVEVFLPEKLSRPGAKTQNPKTSFVEPQGTTTPNHFSSKPFARHTNTNQPRRMAVFQSLRYMLLLALLVVVLSSCDTSEPSYTKQSFMNAKEHSNTETLFQRKCRGIQLSETSIPKLILRRSKPSFQPSNSKTST